MSYRDELLEKIRRNERDYLMRKRRSEQLWSNATNKPPAEVPTYWRVYFAKRNGKPCIYEYTGYKTTWYGSAKKNRLVDKLLFQNDPHRKYYLVGDKIMNGEQDEETLNKYFPELSTAKKRNADWKDLLWLFLNDGEKEKYKFCWVIKSIEPNGKGGGTIGFTGLIHFEGYNVELTTIHKRTREQLHDSFTIKSYNFTGIIFLAKAVTTITVIALQGISKAATAPVKHLAKKLIKKEIKKRASGRIRKMLFKAATSKIMKTATASAAEFVKVFAKEINKRHKEASFYKNITGNAAPWKVLEPALMAAMVALIGKLVDELFTETIGEPISNMEEVKKIERELAKIYLNYLMTTHVKNVIDALYKAWEKSHRNKKPISFFLEEELKKNFQDSIKQIFTKEIPAAILG